MRWQATLLTIEQSDSDDIYGRTIRAHSTDYVPLEIVLSTRGTAIQSLHQSAVLHSPRAHTLIRHSVLHPRMSADNGMPYDVAVQKGYRLASSFSANMPASQWQNFQDLDSFGWAMAYQEPGDENGAPLPQDESKINMYRDLQLLIHPGYNYKCTMRHMFDNGGFHPTRAFYSCV